MRTRRTGLLAVLSIGAVFATLGVAWGQQTITCESRNYNYKYCRADTDSRVTLTRELSSSGCMQGRSWGYDARGVWVDNGCRAEFRVGRSSGGDSGGAVGAVAAVAGIAILAAVLANNKDDDRHNDRDVPSWAIGRFRGYNPQYDTQVELEIQSSANVTAWFEGQRREGYWSDDTIVMGGDSVHVYREPNGFRTEDTRDRGNVVHYGRAR